MKYRAILSDPLDTTRERPMEIYGCDAKVIRDWATAVLKSAVSDDAMVMVYELVEKQVEVITKPKPEKAGSGV